MKLRKLAVARPAPRTRALRRQQVKSRLQSPLVRRRLRRLPPRQWLPPMRRPRRERELALVRERTALVAQPVTQPTVRALRRPRAAVAEQVRVLWHHSPRFPKNTLPRQFRPRSHALAALGAGNSTGVLCWEPLSQQSQRGVSTRIG